MSQKINLYWYRHKEGNGNFGDELNPYLIERVTGKKAKYIQISYLELPMLLFVKQVTYQLINKGIGFSTYILYLYYYFISRPYILVAIGSVLEHLKSSKYIVWGSGMIFKDSELVKADYRAVRGYHTANRLKELGYHTNVAVGDPALLLPLVYTPRKLTKYKIGIIPHHQHYNSYTHLNSDEILVIDLLENIEHIIDSINRCEVTFSTSLHGIIVSHAYNIPSLWIVDDEKALYGDNIKFADYFSSVNINPYEPQNTKFLSLNVNDNLEILYKYDQNVLLPNKKVIEKIQGNLLRSFPYAMKSEYKKYL